MKQLFISLLLSVLFGNCIIAQTNSVFSDSISTFEILPSITDPRISTANTPHFVAYDSNMKQGKLLLFLSGTNGFATKGPKKLFFTAIQQGYRVINLSYINNVAIAQICRGEVLKNNINCAEEFRQKRVFGNNSFALIADKPQDAIVNRLTKLLVYLTKNDKDGNWDLYLDGGNPKWEEIAVIGQSQGGGMATFIAKQKLVYKAISFSGGWDYSDSDTKEIAPWYFKKSITPVNRYYGTYHVREPASKTINQSYEAMDIPKDHIYAFDLEVPKGRKAHGDPVGNIAYLKQWIEILGNGN